MWTTTKQRLIPGRLLGRVSSLDWFISIGLVPLSYALVGPVAGVFGARDDARRGRAHRRRDHLRLPVPARDAGHRATGGDGRAATPEPGAAWGESMLLGLASVLRTPGGSPGEGASLMCSAADSDTWVMKQRAWLLYLVTAEAALFAYLFVPGFRQGFVFNLIALSSPIAIVQAVRMWKPAVKAPWYLFALGQAFFVAGDVITYNYEKFFGTALPFPSIGDVLYLSVYPCLIAGILLLVRRRSPGRDREGLIDSLIIAVGLGVISWSFLMGPIAHDSSSTPLQKLVSMGYPFMDLVLLTVVVRLAIAPGRRGLAFYLLPAAALFLFATDFLYSYISVQGLVYDQSGYLEAGWATFYILWGAAALHPSMAALSDRAPDKEIRLTRARLVLLGAALAHRATRIGVVQLLRGEHSDLWVITGSTTILFILVAIRMSGLVHKLELSFGREKALRTAGASLVTATNRESIYAAAMYAASPLANQGRARLLVRVESEERTALRPLRRGRDVRRR